MDLKIFDRGEDSVEVFEKSVTDFINSNIIYRQVVQMDGSVYLFYKNPLKSGNERMEYVEIIDKLIKKAEEEIFISELDMEQRRGDIADIKEKKKETDTNTKEWDKLHAREIECDNQIKMHKDTIEERKKQSTIFKMKLQELINEK